MILAAIPRSARFALGVLATLALAGGVIGFTWYAVQKTTEARRLDAEQRTNATATGLAGGYAEQINRQVLAFEQTFSTMVRDWEADPRQFDLEAERARSVILTGISRDMFLADEHGIVRQSSVPEFIGQNIGDLKVFRDAAEHSNDKAKLYLGAAAVNPLMRQWHLDAARTLHHPDGSFAGIIDADYRLSAITDIFAASALAGDGFAGLIGLTDGKLRVAAGATPDASIADTKMFAAVDSGASGLWVGPSATDATVRMHAYRRIPGRDLAVVAGLSQQEAMQPVATWRWQARAFASAITGLTAIITIIVLGQLRSERRRAEQDARFQASLAAANALAEVSRAQRDAVERRLHATFDAVDDGVAIFDAHLNLVDWNALFAERSGGRASLTQTGLPMEDVLRFQVRSGCFGEGLDVETEVERRAALLRAGNFGASQSFQVAERAIEMRCRPLAEGGFVALYTDVTEARRVRQALRDAHAALGHEHASRMRFLEAIAHELRARTDLLMRTIARIDAKDPPERMLEPVRLVGESLADLAADAVEVPLMEAGTLPLRPELIGVRPLLRDAVAAIQPAASDRGITVYLVAGDDAPAELIADPARLRQIMTVLLTEGLRYAAPDTMWMLADGSVEDGAGVPGLRLTVRMFGTPIMEAARAGIFPSLDGIAVSDGAGEQETGTGLGPAIARHLAMLMGGQLHCESWSAADGRTGNDFVLSLPPELLPARRGRPPGQVPAQGRALPRTRILLAGAPTGPRLAAVTMLRRDGHMVDAVATGREAVRALDGIPYDIAFLDAALSDMKVATAVSAIRDLSGPPRTTPLIVLTAPVEAVEQLAWRNAGVTDVLTGEPTLEQFTGVITQHFWHGKSLEPGIGSIPGLADELEDGVPVLAVERITELRANLPGDELLEMAEECIADLFRRLPALRRSLSSGSAGAITAQAHAMVGMAGGYGMAVLEGRLRAILAAVRNHRLDTISGAAAMVEADLTRAAAALRLALRTGQTARSGVQT